MVQDISAQLDKYTLDTHGFQYIKHKSKLSKDDFADDEKVRAVYYPESIDLIKKMYAVRIPFTGPLWHR